MFCALLTSRYQVSVYRTNGPLVLKIEWGYSVQASAGRRCQCCIINELNQTEATIFFSFVCFMFPKVLAIYVSFNYQLDLHKFPVYIFLLQNFVRLT